jgi:hypothetical protein
LATGTAAWPRRTHHQPVGLKAALKESVAAENDNVKGGKKGR